MNRKLWISAAVAVVGLFLVAWLASPVLSAQGLIRAAREGDAAALERHVDFPAFRDSVKKELNDKLVARMREDVRTSDPALAGLGLLLAPSLVSGMVDMFVTPEAISAMVTMAAAPDPVPPATERETPRDREGGRVRQSWGYRGLNTFAVTLTRDDRPRDRVVLLMERRGLFGWKLAGLDLSEPR